MSGQEGERAQSVVIGSLLIFAIIVLAFSGYQAFAVPNQNAQVEVDHYQTVEEQFSELRTNVINAVDSDETRSTSIKLGTRYPSRMVALNPPPASGRLETTDQASVEIPSPTENICHENGGNVHSRSLVYEPGYHEYHEAESISYENRIIGSTFRDGAVYDQRLVRSASPDEISLYLLTGDVDENGVDAYSLEVNASHEYTTSVSALTIVVPSQHTVDTWNDEIFADRGDVTVTSASGDRVRLAFTGGPYEVSCAVVGLDGDPAFVPPAENETTDDSGSTTTTADFDYGIGGASTYSRENDTHTVSSRNGLLSGVTRTDELILHGGRTVWDPNDGADELEYEVMIENTTTGELFEVRYRYSKQPGNSPERKVTIFDDSGNNFEAETTDGTAAAVVDGSNPSDGADLLDLTSYKQPGSDFNSSVTSIKRMAGEETDVITTAITGRVDVTLREEALFTGVQPRPRQGDDLEFVRLHIETETDTTGWEFVDDEGETTTLPETTLRGNVYFAKDEAAFEDAYGLDDDKVYPLNTPLEDTGDSLRLIDDQGRDRDEVAYVSDGQASPTTSNGWRVDGTAEGIVAVRRSNDAGHADNDSRDDWNRVDQNNVFFDPVVPKVAFVPTSDDQNLIQTVNNRSEVVNVTVDTKQVGIIGPMADLTNDGATEVPFVDSNNRLKYAGSDGTVQVLAYSNQNQRINPKKQPIGVGRHAGDARPTVYYVNNSNYLYSVTAGGSPSVVEPDLVNDNDGPNTFKPTGVAGLADFDADGDREVIMVNQTAIAYLDETQSGSSTVRIRDLGTRPQPDGNERQIAEDGVGKPFVHDGRVQVPVVDEGAIILVDEAGSVTSVHTNFFQGNQFDEALGTPIAPRDWDGDGNTEILFINDNPSPSLDTTQKSITLIEVAGPAAVRSVYDDEVKEKGVG